MAVLGVFFIADAIAACVQSDALNASTPILLFTSRPMQSLIGLVILAALAYRFDSVQTRYKYAGLMALMLVLAWVLGTRFHAEECLTV